ncbi:MAG: DUF421 domain-containing protein [Acutalibacteraceae bacterium]
MMIRGLLIYLGLIISVRLMGKRQIGELQPSELVTTLLLSEVASMPLQDKDISLLTCVVLIFLIVSLEIIFSVLAVNFAPFRKLMQGTSALIIENGKIKQNKLKQIRYSIDDLMEALRLKDVFDISTVKYAYVETNGSVSVMLRENAKPVTSEDMKITKQAKFLQCLVVSDGKVVDKDFTLCKMSHEKLEKILKREKIDLKDIFIMTADLNDNYCIIKKEQI